MRRPLLLPAIASLALIASAVEACAPDPLLDTECARAAHRFSECGATLPALEGATCSATQKAIATCINNNASTCEALAALYQRIDVCVAGLLNDDGGAPPEIEDIPSIASKPKDAGADAPKQPPRTPPSIPDEADASVVDASIPIDAGGPSTSAWEGFTVTGAIASGASRQWVTPVLEPGKYRFALTGTGDADLYVRIGAAASTTLFDCRPFLNGSTESCMVNVTTASKVYLMLRGIAMTSTFTLEGSPQ